MVQTTEVTARSLPTPPLPTTPNTNQVEETEQTRDRLKWGRSMLQLAKLKTTT